MKTNFAHSDCPKTLIKTQIQGIQDNDKNWNSGGEHKISECPNGDSHCQERTNSRIEHPVPKTLSK